MKSVQFYQFDKKNFNYVGDISNKKLLYASSDYNRPWAITLLTQLDNTAQVL